MSTASLSGAVRRRQLDKVKRNWEQAEIKVVG